MSSFYLFAIAVWTMAMSFKPLGVDHWTQPMTVPPGTKAYGDVTISRGAIVTIPKDYKGSLRSLRIVEDSQLVIEDQLQVTGDLALDSGGQIRGIPFEGPECVHMGTAKPAPLGGKLTLTIGGALKVLPGTRITVDGLGSPGKSDKTTGSMGCVDGGLSLDGSPGSAESKVSSGYAAGGGGGSLHPGESGISLVYLDSWQLRPGGDGGHSLKAVGGGRGPSLGGGGGAGQETGYERYIFRGGNGGGIIEIMANSLELQGLLSARGTRGQDLSGGGGGGTILLRIRQSCRVLQNGRIEVQGGDAGSSRSVGDLTARPGKGGDGQTIIDGSECPNKN